jgi:hypothetical protein
MTEGACLSCGRAPGLYSLAVELNGQLVGTSPRGWVYAYRGLGIQIGLCDQCFAAGRFTGLSRAEIDYFTEEFGRPTESEGDA